MDPIRVMYHQEAEGWWAESPDIPGWYVTGKTFEAARSLAESHVRFALDRSGVQVEHYLRAGERLSA